MRHPQVPQCAVCRERSESSASGCQDSLAYVFRTFRPEGIAILERRRTMLVKFPTANFRCSVRDTDQASHGLVQGVDFNRLRSISPMVSSQQVGFSPEHERRK